MAIQRQVEALYADHHGWLQGWLQRKLGCSHGAADLTQDTFLRILNSRDALLGAIQTPRAYLTTTAKRLLVDRSRRQVIEQAYLQKLALIAGSLPGHPSPDEILVALQALEQIGAALDGLAPKPRAAFLRHYLDEHTHAAIAAELGVSTRMVQKYLVQALLHCRAQCQSLSQHGI
ncbi:sigma-70 family RNA polymerase sigma factor [Duganella sp. FT80W]|uniref:Sigma-70 family RNA polymerase sigma factor n=1 Tax=Duganella guangzhouensis TaxID=2666084 RepID=A0A6I2L5H2_9BURK|nr:sigma-70 family RNA polymerase sigma factor [Duganella guangzhouensis]MRW92932.1 sigma-70 family RNA polymerase sigma factor [Duganella guangzhouensis]